MAIFNKRRNSAFKKDIMLKNRVGFFVKLFVVASAFLLFIVWVLTYSMQDSIKQKLVSEIKGSIASDVYIEEVNLSFWKKFPNTSLELKNIVCNNSENTDTLFKFTSVFLKINVLKLLRKKIEINQLALFGGAINIFDGEEHKNYMIWNSNDTTSNHSLLVNTIEIEDLVLIYNNTKDIKSDIFLREFKGMKKRDKILFSVDFENRKTLFQGKSIKETQVMAEGEIKTEENNIKSIRANTTLNNTQAQLELEMAHKGRALSVIIKEADVEGLLKEINTIVSEPIYKGNIQGSLTTELKISLIEEKTSVSVDFFAKNISLQERINLNKMNFSGKIRVPNILDKSTYTLIVDSVWSQADQNKVFGSCEISNMQEPTYKGEIEFDINAKKTIGILPESVNKIEGRFSGKVKLDSEKKLTEGQINSKEIKLFLASLNYPINVQKVIIGASQNKLELSTLFFINKDTLQLEGQIKNLQDLYIHKPKLVTQLNLQASAIHLSEIIKQSPGSDKINIQINLPPWIETYINASVSKITHKRLYLKEALGTIKIKENRISCLDCSFNSMNGTVVSDFILEDNGRNLDLYVDAEFKKIDIEKIFYDFNEFGQDYITSSHIKGKGTTKGVFKAQFNRDFQIIPNKVDLLADITLENGELENFTPLYDLSKYINIEDLNHIYFSTLTNQIRIDNEIVNIPFMKIESSALNLNMQGSHSFGNKINYEVNLLLSEILFNKKKREKKILDNIIMSKNERGPSLHLTMTGDASSPEIKFTKIAFKENKIQSIEDKEKNSSNFIYEWDEK